MARQDRKDRLVRLPKPLDERLRARAETRLMYVNEAIVEAIEDWLDTEELVDGYPLAEERST